MDDRYPLLDVSDWNKISYESMGTKPKFWLQEPNVNRKWLFKHRHRETAGDDWAEKIAAELASHLLLPHAKVELANHQGLPGIISLDLVGAWNAADLVLGNNLLVESDANYPRQNRYHVPQHTLDRVFTVLGADYLGIPELTFHDPGIVSPVDLFVGYLLLDAWIANLDRHHENWAILLFDSTANNRRGVLCPTFDHASCLAHSLTDAEREKRITTKDRGYSVEAFVRKARCALFRDESAAKPMLTHEAFCEAAARRPTAGRFWLHLLRRISAKDWEAAVDRVPEKLMSPVCRQFAKMMLAANHADLSSLGI